jgi:hypothetical protein
MMAPRDGGTGVKPARFLQTRGVTVRRGSVTADTAPLFRRSGRTRRADGKYLSIVRRTDRGNRMVFSHIHLAIDRSIDMKNRALLETRIHIPLVCRIRLRAIPAPLYCQQRSGNTGPIPILGTRQARRGMSAEAPGDGSAKR